MEKYKLKEIDSKTFPKFQYRKRVQQIQAPFLKGPIPLDWLQEAMRLGGAAISVGIVLWYFGGLKKVVIFKVGIQDVANLIGRSWLTAKRGLLLLEQGGLIGIERHPGRKHLIKIRDVNSTVANANS